MIEDDDSLGVTGDDDSPGVTDSEESVEAPARSTDEQTTIVLKLGGSLITEKDARETVDDEALSSAAAAIGDALADGAIDRLVLVHGAGSFGHYYADRHGLSRTAGTHDAEAVCEVHAAMGRLTRLVLDRLHDAGVAAVPVRPFSAGSRDEAGALALATEQVATMVGEGFVPVLHGDVIAQAGAGATIISGDELVTALADALDADRVGVCGTVPGVLDDEGAVIPAIGAYEEVAHVLGESDSTDVTGGMAGKVQELLALDAPAAIFGPADLEAFLAGEDVGTRVDGRA